MMSRWVLLVVAAAGSTADADDVCMPSSSEVRVAVLDGVGHVCAKGDAGERCLGIAPGGPAKRATTVPASVATLTAAQVKDDQVCNGATCKKLGPKVVEALHRKHEGDERKLDPEVTDDLAVILIDAGPWSVAKDKPLDLVKPKAYGKGEAG